MTPNSKTSLQYSSNSLIASTSLSSNSHPILSSIFYSFVKLLSIFTQDDSAHLAQTVKKWHPVLFVQIDSPIFFSTWDLFLWWIEQFPFGVIWRRIEGYTWIDIIGPWIKKSKARWKNTIRRKSFSYLAIDSSRYGKTSSSIICQQKSLRSLRKRQRSQGSHTSLFLAKVSPSVTRTTQRTLERRKSLTNISDEEEERDIDVAPLKQSRIYNNQCRDDATIGLPKKNFRASFIVNPLDKRHLSGKSPNNLSKLTQSFINPERQNSFNPD